MATSGPIQRYNEFWPFYLREHSKPVTRRWHFFGTTLFLLSTCLAVAAKKPKLLMLTPVAGYGPAWISHFFVEHNKPATFKYPLWSLISDFRMYFLWIGGRLNRELARHGIEAKKDP